MTTLQKLQNLDLERVGRSARFRAMNALARFEPVRTLVRLGGRAVRDIPSDTLPSANVPNLLGDLQRDGIARSLQLESKEREEIKAWAQATPCFGNLRKDFGFHTKDREAAEKKAGTKFTVAHYFNSFECPAIQRLVHDPALNELARAYVGPHARYTAAHAWWSFATDVPAADRNTFAQAYHFDLDDYRFMKVFFYLTDVDMDSGPHTYMRGTHAAKPLRDLFPMRRFSDEEVYARWGKDREIFVTGPAGSGFVVDTFGLHKGTPPRTRDRLVLELEWGVRYYGFGNDVVPPRELKLL